MDTQRRNPGACARLGTATAAGILALGLLAGPVGTCRELVLSFRDGTVAQANFKFK